MEKKAQPNVVIVSCSPYFEASIKRLKRRFRSVKADIEKALTEIESTGDLGYAIPRHDGTVFKKRVGSSDIPRGKRDCYRLYLYQPIDSLDVWPIYVLFKGDAPDVASKEIEDFIKDLGQKKDC